MSLELAHKVSLDTPFLFLGSPSCLYKFLSLRNGQMQEQEGAERVMSLGPLKDAGYSDTGHCLFQVAVTEMLLPQFIIC